MFKPRFAPLVEAGTKPHTVRPTPKRMPKVGDKISLRMWMGRPYGSKQRVLRESVVTKVEPIRLIDTGRELIVTMAGRALEPEEINAFAQADGFAGGLEMFDWFEATHGLPFEGIVIHWEVPRA
jgi:hypothetical protein